MEYGILVGGLLTGLVLRTFGVYFLEKLIALREGKDIAFDKKFFLEPLIALGIVSLGLAIAALPNRDMLNNILEMDFLTAVTYAFFTQSVVRLGSKLVRK